MSKLTFPIIDLKNTPDEWRVNSRVRICVECGYSKPDAYEFGISCEFCGSLFVFSEKIMNKKRRHEF